MMLEWLKQMETPEHQESKPIFRPPHLPRTEIVHLGLPILEVGTSVLRAIPVV